MSAHLIADPTTAATAVYPAAPGWSRLSAALTDEVPVIADREDLLVTIAPGAGHGAPACYLPNRATIEVDGTHLGTVDPATATPDVAADRARYASAWGLLTHECAHAAHSTWEAPDAPAGAVEAALLLEESRIEGAHIRRRPDDRHWLRASATELILADTKADDPAHAPRMTTADAAQTAALLLARVDAGILTAAETHAVHATVETVLGATTLATLRELWRKAQACGDDDADAMIDLGRRWCEAIGTDPDTSTQPDSATPSGDPTGGGTSGDPSPLAQAVQQAAATVAANVATEPVPEDPAAAAAAARAQEQAAQQQAMTASRSVFGTGGPRGGTTRTAGTRPPTSEERAAARRLGRALTTAAVRERAVTKTGSVLPPGRLRMRGALAADAQRAAGALPTAEPFVRTTRATVPAPPLKIGIACDVSGSMGSFAGPVASAAWILAHAARHAQVPATAATVIFGHHVRPLTHPGIAPTAVTEFECRDNWEEVHVAIDALDGTLDLARPDAARLVVIVSDGDFREIPRAEGQARINRLRATGCAVLWLAPDRGPSWPCTPLDGTTVHPLVDPAATAQAIGRAATHALRTTH